MENTKNEAETGLLLLLHPKRKKIIEALKDGKPRYIDEIAEMIHEDRRIVSFHLMTLEENGFLESQLKFIEEPDCKGRAGRFYTITKKLENMRPELIKAVENL